MASEVTIPRLGWNMDEGIFVGWLKADGEPIKAGEPLFNLEGDKATQEIESLEAGILRIPPDGPKDGEKVAVGVVIGYLVGPGEPAPFESRNPGAPSIAPSPSVASGGQKRRISPRPPRGPGARSRPGSCRGQRKDGPYRRARYLCRRWATASTTGAGGECARAQAGAATRSRVTRISGARGQLNS